MAEARWIASVAEVPATCDALFAAGGFYGSRAWYEVVERTALPVGAEPAWLLVCDPAPVTLFALLRQPDGRLASLTTPYTCLHGPLTAPGLPDVGLRAVGQAFARAVRGAGLVRLDALDAAWPGWAPLLAGARRGGLWTLRFDHFGNWHQDVAGQSWTDYAGARAGELRETIRRKLRRIARDPDVSFDLVRGGPGLDAAIAAYRDVYARSWKDPEPFPEFTPALVRMMADQGCLRLGVLRAGGTPIAAQLWLVDQGTASVLKLAHDEAYKSLSPGTSLTALMIRGLLDDEGVTGLDFGRGDDPYKRGWMAERRQRIGVLLANPLHRAGLAALARAAGGRLVRRLRA